MIFLIGLATLIFTMLGGLFAIHFKDKLHLILGFSAGAITGVAFFDLLPEAIDLSNKYMSIFSITSIVALGFVLYMILDRMIFVHSHHEKDEECKKCQNKRGILGAGSLSFHSFLDGVVIGLAFHISSSIGIIVSTAVLIHDFSDGINTVSMILKNKGSKNKALKWLIIDATTPMLGIISTFFFTLKDFSLGVLLALFCGFFLYIGASDLLPESHHSHPTKWTTISTILGMVILYGVIRLASL